MLPAAPLLSLTRNILPIGKKFNTPRPSTADELHRQVIYLDVSRPKGLVNIQKAINEAGQLSDTVTNFITNELKLKATVPALKLEDDGTLIGGSIEGKDCLLGQPSENVDYPGVVVGPDTNPTLSFTSGSEGRPKGVLGKKLQSKFEVCY